MSKNSQPVPRLDLAPKLSRPLSLWNPFDYLRLLYWVFFTTGYCRCANCRAIRL
jgi:hypothetical protein